MSEDSVLIYITRQLAVRLLEALDPSTTNDFLKGQCFEALGLTLQDADRAAGR